MADEELPPPEDQPEDQPDEAPGGGPSPDDVMDTIRRLIRAELDQRDARGDTRLLEMEARLSQQIKDTTGSIHENLSQRLAQAIASLEAKSQAASSGGGQVPPHGRTTEAMGPEPEDEPLQPKGGDLVPAGGQEVALPDFPMNPQAAIGAQILQWLNNPVEFANTVRALRMAFAKQDDFQMAREIAARNPYAIVSVAPDPLGGNLPNLLTNILNRGVQIGTSVRGPAVGGGTSPLAPNPASGPGNSSAVPPATSPTPPAASTPASGATSNASLNQSLESLSDDDINTLMAQLALISHRRRAA